MNAKSTFALLVTTSSLLLFACAAPEESNETAQVQLAAEDAAPMPLNASFLSDTGTFSYHFAYDGTKAALVAEGLEGASPYGASFKLDGSAEITTQAGTLDVLGFTDVFSTLELIGGREFYRYAKADATCHYELAGTVYDGNEGLLVQMRVCEGEEAGNGLAIFEEILGGLTLEAAPESMLE